MTPSRDSATLIGDVIGSRDSPDREGLQRELRETLFVVGEALAPFQVQALEPTVGDEFQGVFVDVVFAMQASLMLRLQLLKQHGVDSRYGLGFGEVTVFEERTPLSQDGPGWWSARSAIEEAKHLESQSGFGFVRTRFHPGRSQGRISDAEAGVLNASLIYRDALIAKMRPRSRRLLLGMLLRRPQADLAAEEGISQSAVSQNLTRSGAYAFGLSDDELRRRS
jgi:SatD family (SatD)